MTRGSQSTTAPYGEASEALVKIYQSMFDHERERGAAPSPDLRLRYARTLVAIGQPEAACDYATEAAVALQTKGRTPRLAG